MTRRKSPNEVMIVDEKQLLVNSSFINEHEYLIPSINRFDKIFKDDLEIEEYKVYFTEDVANFFRYSFDTLMEAVEEQWEQTVFYEVIERGKQPCELCGNKQVINLYKIRNTVTNKELFVGSECIGKFKISKSVEVSQSIRKKKKDADSFRRQVEINVKIPSIGEQLREWYRLLNDNPIVLPGNLETDTRILINDSNDLYEDYINGKQMGIAIIKIKEFVPKILNCFESITSFNNKNQNKPYICTRELKRWITQIYGESPDVLDIIKGNNGFICNATIKYIHNMAFVQLQLNLIHKHLSEHKFEFINNNENLLYFKYKRDEHYTFALQCSPSMFMEKCAELSDSTFSINIIEFKNLLNFADKSKEIDTPIGFCNELIRGTGFYIFQNDANHKYYVVKNPNLQRDRDGYEMRYSLIDISHILDKIRLGIYTKTDDELIETLKSYLNQLRNWKSKKEYKELNEIDNEFLRGDNYIYRKPRR
ncbi:MAG: hypothetical protein FWE91_10835 [Defluviitaleaceae bacterium]|nr:hypothetical protein [Defluviitaleaceae bacterium]